MDGGAPVERTALSWERTGFGVLGVGGLLTHAGRSHAGVLLVAGLVVLVLGALVSTAYAPLRYRHAERAIARGTSPRPSPTALRALTAVIIATAVVTTTAVLLP